MSSTDIAAMDQITSPGQEDKDNERPQPVQIPSGDSGRRERGLSTARPTAGASPAAGHNFRPELLHIDEAFRNAGSITRDFEQAVVDEDGEEKRSPGLWGGTGQEDFMARQGSASPGMARRSTLLRASKDEREREREKPGRSRASSASSSSRSTSPPNSVNAFAEPRRRERAGTLGSRAPSDLDVSHPQRTVSGGTHRRRPTFSERRHPEILQDEAKQSDSENEVYLGADESENYVIDFEALDEFVAENAIEHAKMQERQRHVQPRAQSQGSQKRAELPRMDSEPRSNGPIVAQLLRGPASPSRDNGTEDLEKGEQVIEEKVTSDKASSHTGSHTDLRPIQGVGEIEQNRFNFFSSDMDLTIHSMDLGGLLLPGETFKDLFTLDPEGGVWWLDIVNPSSGEISALTKAFSIHPLTSEDIRTQEAREKVELFKQYYFVCFRSFYQVDKKSEDYMEPVNVYVIVFRQGALSFTFCQSPHADNVRRRISKMRDYVSLNLSADWICYAMIDDIVDTFGPVIHDIERETDMIEDSVFVARAIDRSALLRQIGECRKKVMGLMRLLGGKADVIKGFAKRCNEQYSVTPRGDIGLYLGDIQDHVITMMSSLSHFEMMLSRSHSNYLAQLQVDNIAQGTRANEVLSKMTIIATILVPMNLICGLFGMNVPVPGKESGGLGWFFGIIGVIVSIVFCSIAFLKKFRYV